MTTLHLWPCHPRFTVCGLLAAAVLGATPAAQGGEGAPMVNTVNLLDVLDERLAFATQGWGVMGVNTCAHQPGLTPLPLQIGEQHYDQGLGLHAPSVMILELDGQFAAFEAEVGVQWQNHSPGSVVFEVWVDGEQRFASGVMHDGEPAQAVRVDLTGAEELVLVSGDAGDGVTSDCANWVNARLTRNPNAAALPPRPHVNMAPFARVMTSDPERRDGVRATRTEPFPAADVRLETDVVPDNGVYTVPTDAEGRGAIGLEWAERRRLHRLSLTFAPDSPLPDPAAVRVELWPGESRWQGEWQPTQAELNVHDRTLSADLSLADNPGLRRQGVWKARWILPPSDRPLRVSDLGAYSRERWDTAELRLELAEPRPGQRASLEVYNGELLGDGDPLTRTWDLGGPLTLPVRYSTRRWQRSEQTVLRLRLPGDEPGHAFGIAVHDVLNRGPVWVPHVGVYMVQADAEAPSLAAYREQIAAQQTVRERVAERPDQTFAQALEHVHNPVLDSGPTMLSLACANDKFLVQRSGEIGPLAYVAPETAWCPPIPTTWRVLPRFGGADTGPLTRKLYGGWLPAPRITVPDGDVTYQQTTYVVPLSDQPADPEGWLYERAACVADYTVANGGEAAAPVQLALTVEPQADELSGLTVEPRPKGVAVVAGDRLLAVLDTRQAAPLTVGVDGRTLTITGELPAGATARLRWLLPTGSVAADDAARLAAVEADLDTLANYWQGVMADGMTIELPDPMLADLIRASQVHCYLAARNEADGERVAAWIASILYGPIDTEPHSILLGMDEFGHHDFSRRGLDFFRHRYTADGDNEFLTYAYTLMGTGQHLWTLADHLDLSGNDAYRAEVLPDVRKLTAWIAAQVDKTKLLDGQGQPVPEYGLAPPGVIADWSLFAYRSYLEGHFYAGLAAGAELLAEADDPAAAQLQQDAEAMRGAIQRSFTWAEDRAPVARLQDGTWVPMMPGMVYCFGEVEAVYPGEDATRSWASDSELGSHHLITLGALLPDSPQADWIMDRLEDDWFLRTGLGYYDAEGNQADWYNRGGFAKIQPYYGRIPEAYEAMDEVKSYIRAYFNAIPSLLNTEDLSLFEHFGAGQNFNKTHETGWFLSQSRRLLLGERQGTFGDELWLAPFVPEHWLRDGQTVAVSDAPTDFGRVSYRIESHADAGHLDTTIDPPTREAPAAIVLCLRHPDGRALREATATGAEAVTVDAERGCVRLRPTGGVIRVRAKFE